jgi:hypothetical protein
MSKKEHTVFFRVASIVCVSLYLAVVYVVLRAKRRIRPPFSLAHIARTWFRAPFRGELTGFSSEKGFCWLAGVPDFILSDRESFSKLLVLEDGVPLPVPHAAHDTVRREGKGAYSHWGSVIYLSTTDNTDPSTNGRKYEVVEQK